MPRSKTSRRRARQEKARRAALWQVYEGEEEPGENGDGEAGPVSRAVSLRKPQRPSASPASATDPTSVWSRNQLAVLLLFMAVTICILGVIIGVEERNTVPLAVAVTNWSPIFVIFSAPATSSMARSVSHAPRNLRFMEAMTFGSVLAVAVTLCSTVIAVAPRLDAKNVPHWTTADAVPLLSADLLAVGITFLILPRVARWVAAGAGRGRRRRGA